MNTASRGDDLNEREDVPILGRTAELTALNAQLSRAKAGTSAVVWIEGEAGIGKSRLLAEALATADRAGFTVLRGESAELERGRPFGALVDVFAIGPESEDQRRRALHELIFGASTAEPMAGPDYAVDVGHRVIEALLTLLEEAAMRTPVFLALEDLHWADPSTVRAVYSIVRRTTHLPFVLVGTFRPVPRTDDMQRLISSTEAHLHLRLDPLDDRTVAELTEHLVTAPPGRSLLAQVAEAAGNPLFVIELVRALRDEKAIQMTSGVAEARAAPRPPTLRLTILRRITFLPAAVLDVLRVASILGFSFSLADLTAVTGRTAADLMGAIREAVGAGILTDSGARLAFRHDLIREALYDDLPAGVRAGLHFDAARALEAAGAPALQIAEHVSLGATPGDISAVHRLREAARTSLYVAPAAAARLLERALELAPASDSIRQGVASELLMPLYLTGRVADADALAREVLAHGTDPHIEYLVRRSLAYSLVIRGHASEAVDEYRRVVDMRGAAWGQSADANHSIDVTNLALSLLTTGDAEGARASAEEALAIAGEAGSDLATTLALLTLANIADAQGRNGDSVDLAGRGMRIAGRDASAGNFWAHWTYGVALADADRLDEAEATIRTGLQLVEDRGRVTQMGTYQLALQLVLFHAGRWDDSLTAFEAGLGLETGSAVLVQGRALAAYVALHRGAVDVAARTIAEAEQDAMRTGLRIGLDAAAYCKALLLDVEGEHDQALALALGTWDLTAPVRYSYSLWRTFAPAIVRLALAGGDREGATRVTEDAEEGARRAPGVGSAEATALRCRGILEGDADVLRRAVGLLGQRPMDRALAAEEAALAIASQGKTSDARSMLDVAVEEYERVGGVHDISRATATMRRLGIRRRSRRPPRPTTGWESLTPTELQAVRLVGTGLSNAEIAKRMFISRYTVETHLKHVYAKLGIASRTELALQAAKRSPSD